MREHSLYCQRVGVINKRPIDSAPVTLERNSRVDKSIGEHPRSLSQVGANHLVHVLCSIGSKHKEFGSVGFRLAFPVKKKLAELMPKRCAARFPCVAHDFATFLESSGKEFVECGFSTSIDALESDEGGG